MDGLDRDLRALGVPVVRLGVSTPVGRSLAAAYGVRRVPTLLVLDGTGEPRLHQSGSVAGGAVRDAVDGLLAAASAHPNEEN